jgi:hypothetical protein
MEVSWNGQSIEWNDSYIENGRAPTAHLKKMLELEMKRVNYLKTQIERRESGAVLEAEKEWDSAWN